jgi:hypothetical protein
MPTKVKPLPGFSDQYPYNTKEWQDEYKRTGQPMFLSGVPPGAMQRQMQGNTPGQQGLPAGNANPGGQVGGEAGEPN